MTRDVLIGLLLATAAGAIGVAVALLARGALQPATRTDCFCLDRQRISPQPGDSPPKRRPARYSGAHGVRRLLPKRKKPRLLVAGAPLCAGSDSGKPAEFELSGKRLRNYHNGKRIRTPAFNNQDT
jgi:hypothetical protein